MVVRAVREARNMVKKLADQEKQQSRQLWEEIFTEDSREFLDYYYKYKLKENEIFGSFSGETLVAMLQLNPYKLCVGTQEADSYYIVAVATKEKYRHQGRMAQLLKKAMLEAEGQEIPFVFLMPAKEDIYKPFGFVTVYGRKDYRFTSECLSEDNTLFQDIRKKRYDIELEEMTEKDLEKGSVVTELVKYSQRKLKEKYQVFAKRDEQYYIRLMKEQRSQRGGILLARDSSGNEICGYCFLAREDTVQLRELLCDEGREMDILREIWKKYGHYGEIEILGAEFSTNCLPFAQIFPCIMIRITDICRFTKLISLQEGEVQWLTQNPVIAIKDSFIQRNQGVYRVSVERQGNNFFAKLEKEQNWIEDIGKSGNDIPGFTVEQIQKKSFEKLKIFLNEVV